MLQVDVQPYASDALEDAMRLAQTKALNSYSWSDMLNYLNYAWMNLYQRIISIDSGYYSQIIQITRKLTKLPPFMKNSIKVYSAQQPVGFNREVFRASGMNDLQGTSTYHISGFDLYCPSAEYRRVWLEYVPIQPQLFFTRNNRDPKLFDPNVHDTIRNTDYSLYRLIGFINNVQVSIKDLATDLKLIDRYVLQHKDTALLGAYDLDITDTVFFQDPQWQVWYLSCDFPYLFITYRHVISHEYRSGFFTNITASGEFIEYNPFAYVGRNSNVEYVEAHWNDKTGLGVVIVDWNDTYPVVYDTMNEPERYVEKDELVAQGQTIHVPRYKELGWTPDTLLVYPAPEMYRYLVAMLAEKLTALNESDVMGVVKELVEAKFAFEAFLAKDKSAWSRITNVNGPTLADML